MHQTQAVTGPRGWAEVWAYFGLTFVLTIPFWIFGIARESQLLPGLPVAALAVVCPAIAALVLTWRSGGVSDATALLARALDFQRIGLSAWWLLILVLAPSIGLASFFILRLSGSAVPDANITVSATALLFAVFLVSALAEELGWSGFVLGPLQARLGPLLASLLIGAVWAVWHYPALMQAHRSSEWIAWWTLGTVATRIIMVWLFNRTGGSVFGVAVLHAAGNLCWQLFPVHGSWFDPRLNGLLLAGVAVVVTVIDVTHPGGIRRQAGWDR